MSLRREDNATESCGYPDDDLRLIVGVLTGIKDNLDELKRIVPNFASEAGRVEDALHDMLGGVWAALWERLDGFTDEEFEFRGLDSRNIPRDLPRFFRTAPLRPVPTNPATRGDL